MIDSIKAAYLLDKHDGRLFRYFKKRRVFRYFIRYSWLKEVIMSRFADCLACVFAVAGLGYFVSDEEFHSSGELMSQEQHFFFSK